MQLGFGALEEAVVDVHSSDKTCIDKKVNKYHYLRNKSPLLHTFCKKNLFTCSLASQVSPPLALHGSSVPLSVLGKRSVGRGV